MSEQQATAAATRTQAGSEPARREKTVQPPRPQQASQSLLLHGEQDHLHRLQRCRYA